MKKVKVNIYYHGDLDGIFSAVLLARTYLDNNVPCSLSFQEVNYNLSDTWQSNPLCKDYDINAVVDFTYHPDATIWYDHHLSGWGDVTPHLNFRGAFDENAPSCARVILEDVNRPRLKDEQFIRQIIAGIDVVDQAQYDSPEQPYSLKYWFTALRLAFMHSGDTAFQQELIKLFLYNDLCFKRLKNNVIPEIAEWRAAKALYQLEQNYSAFKDVCKLDNRIAHFTVPQYTKVDRYFPFRLHKEALYTIYIRDNTWRGEGVHIAVAKNPFTPQDANVNIRDICMTYGGGGHPAVGGIVVDSLEKAEKIQKEIFEVLSTSVAIYTVSS